MYPSPLPTETTYKLFCVVYCFRFPFSFLFYLLLFFLYLFIYYYYFVFFIMHEAWALVCHPQFTFMLSFSPTFSVWTICTWVWLVVLFSFPNSSQPNKQVLWVWGKNKYYGRSTFRISVIHYIAHTYIYIYIRMSTKQCHDNRGVFTFT